MNWITVGSILCAFVSFVVPPIVSAQPRCDLDDSITECWDRYNGAGPVVVNQNAQEHAKLVAAQTRAEPTGAETGEVDFASATRDFLPLLSLVGLISQSEEGDSGEGAAAFDVNLPFLNTEQRRNLKIRLLVNTKVEVAEAVAAALPEETREELLEQLEEDVNDSDEYTLSLTYNHDNGTYGRSFGPHRQEFAALARTAQESVSTAAANASADAFNALLQSYQDTTGFDPSQPIREWTDSETQNRVILRTVETAAREAAGLDAGLSSALRAARLDRFAELLANQPQFHVTIDSRSRPTLAGGDELRGKVTYEWSRINLNQALADPSCADLSTAAGRADECLAEYIDYVEANAEAIDHALRVSFSGEYVEIDEQPVDLTAVGLDPITVEGSYKRVLALTVSRNWGDDPSAGQPIRWDFQGRYEDVSDDPLRRDRGVATLTLSKKIGGVSFPVAFVYANHSEFLTDVDDKFSAHLGVKFDFSAGR
jgi:hypothetical protein